MRWTASPLIGMTFWAALLGSGRAADGQVTVVGAQADSLVLACIATDCRPRVQLATAASPARVRATVDSLVAADFSVLPVAIVGPFAGGETVAIPANGRAVVTLSATLPTTGTYSGLLTLAQAAGTDRVRLVVKRVRPATTLQVLGLETVRAQSGQVRFWLTLQDTSGRAPAIEALTFTSLTKTGANGRPQAEFSHLTVAADAECEFGGPAGGRRPGAQDTAGGATTGTPTAGPVSQASAPALLQLSPDVATRATVCVVGLEDAGEYAGTLSIKSADAPAIDRAVVIQVRDSGVWAALLIALGVGVSFVIPMYTKTTRPRLLRTARFQAALARLDSLEAKLASPGSAEAQLIADFRDRLASVGDSIVMRMMDTNVDAALDRIERQLAIFPIWIKARQYVEGVRPADLRKQFRTTLLDVEKAVVSPNASAEELTNAENTLSQLSAEVRQAIGERLDTELKTFLTDLNAERSQPHADPAALDAIHGQATEALNCVKEGQFDQARSLLDQARLKYIKLLARQLAAQLASAPPKGMNAASWSVVVTELTPFLDRVERIREEDDVDEAAATYDEAYARYLRARVDALRRHVEDLNAVIDNASTLTAGKKADLKKTLAPPLTRLTEVEDSLAAKRVQEAASLLDRIEREVTAAEAAVPSTGGPMGRGPAPTAATTPLVVHGAVPSGATVSGTFTPVGLQRRDELLAKVNQYDILILLVVLVIAILLGLQLLYFPNPAWGGPIDSLTAFLWGVGLHPVSGVTFEGITGLRNKLSG
jgi:hypothetical protein